MMYLRIKVGAPQSDLKHGNIKFTINRELDGRFYQRRSEV